MCDLCPKYNTCKSLCDKALKEINKSLGKRKADLDNSDSREIILSGNDLDNILYANNLTDSEYSRLSNLVIVILSPKQKRLLKLFSEGKTQRELAMIFNVTQASISQSMKAIKRELSSQLKMVIGI